MQIKLLKNILNHFLMMLNRIGTSLRSSDFIFDCVHLLCYKCHKKNPNRGRSCIDYPDWIKNKKATINPINKKDNKCFQYAATVTLNHEEVSAFWKKNKN